MTIASRNPVLVLALAQNDGVEEIAGPLRAHHAPAALVEVRNGEPYFQSLGLEVNGQLGALEKTAVEHDLAILEGDFAAGLEREIADGALEVAVKFPSRVGLEVDRLLVGGVLLALCQQSFAHGFDELGQIGLGGLDHLIQPTLAFVDLAVGRHHVGHFGQGRVQVAVVPILEKIAALAVLGQH